MTDKEVLGLQMMKLALSEVQDSQTKEEAVERLQRLITKLEEKTIVCMYRMIDY